MIKHHLNMVKHRLLVEKDRGNACRKNQEKKSRFFVNFFRGLSFYGAGYNTWVVNNSLFICIPNDLGTIKSSINKRTILKDEICLEVVWLNRLW